MDEQQPEDYQQAIAKGWLPIREVARQTGVNPVTLRAWERRYGLVVPQRTAKGHRLYTQEQISKIQQVLTWLSRGVAVSQVAELLENREEPSNTDSDNLWQQQRHTLNQAILQLNERQLDEAFSRSQSLYPPHTLCEQLLLPLINELEQRWQGQFGSELERVFFHGWLRSKIGARIYHDNRQHNGAPVLLCNLSNLPFEPGLWLSAWLICSSEQRVQILEWALPLSELALVLEPLQPKMLLLYASQRLDTQALRQHLPRLASGPCPVLLAGPATSIHADELSEISNLQLASDPLQALHLLAQLPSEAL